jgi:hypothetical protein
MSPAAAVALAAGIGAALVAVYLALCAATAAWHRRESVPPVSRRAMQALSERARTNDEDGTP